MTVDDAGTLRVRRALLSVSDKTGLTAFARSLHEQGVELLSTGGTARALVDAGLPVREVSEQTGFPEIMAGRIKTLHPAIHGGILGRRDRDCETMTEHGIEPIDLVVVNLYPFEETIAGDAVDPAHAIEQIDIGGPAMVRAAAKNHRWVGVVTSPECYASVATEIADEGLTAATRRQLAAAAFRHTAEYDGAIADWFADETGAPLGQALPERLRPRLTLRQGLRYGENPHQRAAFYTMDDALPDTVTRATAIQGKAISFNNIADADTALECVKQFNEPACVIVKHANPSGVAVAGDPAAAYEGAYACDPVSAYGGIIAFNCTIDRGLAETLVERQFIEVLVAPEVSVEAAQVLAQKPNVRVLTTGPQGGPAAGLELRSVAGGVLVQDRDTAFYADDGPRTVGSVAVDAAIERDLAFAWKVARTVKSNAIVLAREGRTIGIGAGQMSRVISARLAGLKAADAGLATAGAVMASDAFIPFRDVLDVAAEAGVRAVIQPGGARRDDEVIAAADALGLAMVFTGMRHFRH